MLKTQVTQLISGIAGTRTQSQRATHRGKFGKYFDAYEVLWNKYCFPVFFENKLFQFNWKTQAGVLRKEGKNDCCFTIFFPLPFRGDQ